MDTGILGTFFESVGNYAEPLVGAVLSILVFYLLYRVIINRIDWSNVSRRGNEKIITMTLNRVFGFLLIVFSVLAGISLYSRAQNPHPIPVEAPAPYPLSTFTAVP